MSFLITFGHKYCSKKLETVEPTQENCSTFLTIKKRNKTNLCLDIHTFVQHCIINGEISFPKRKQHFDTTEIPLTEHVITITRIILELK